MVSRAPDSLPKAGTGAFKTLLESILRTLDLPRLALVLEGALDRKSLEGVLRKFLRGGALRPGSIARPELVAAVAEAFMKTPDAAWLTMRALDKSCSKERHIVASIEDEMVEARLTSYRALDFRRERARLLWALVRDGRAGHVKAAERILDEAFAAMNEAERVEQAQESPEAHESQQVIRERFESYEAALQEQDQILQKQRGEQASIEKERSELLVKLGIGERALQAEKERRKDLEEQLHELRTELRGLGQQLDERDPERLERALAERDRLREANRKLARYEDRSERISELIDENEALRGELQQLKRQDAQRQSEQEELVRQLVSKEKAAIERADSLRESLKAARKLAQTTQDPSVVDGEPVTERVGVFLDATNLGASARRDFDGKFDYLRLLPELVGDRKKVMAVAFVVNNDEDDTRGNFAGFVRSLQGAGYEVRQKRPKVRGDGSRKADWDMGIAMEVIDARNRLDVVILGSGDGDFLPLVSRLKRWGKRVEVAAYRASTDADLVRGADEFIALDGRFQMRD